jgi:hypothetical protein
VTSTDVQDIDEVIDVNIDVAAAPTQSEIPASNGALPASEGCMPIDHPEQGLVTQQCHVTPDELRMGVAALWITDCIDADGVSVFCHNKLATAVTQRVELYNGPPIDMVVSSAGMEFPSVNDISETITARGVQMVTTYIGIKLPDSEKIISYLRGKSLRICTTPDELDDETREAYCGTPGVQFGQVTFDIDGDGVFGYMNTTTLTSDSAEETLTPPSDGDYDEFADSFLNTLKKVTPMGYYPFTDASFDGGAGFYAPLIPTFSPQEISVDTTHKFTVSFDVTNVAKYIDGMMSHLLGLPTCVEGVVTGKTTCNGTTSDEGSFGTYNPFYDAGLYSESPKVEFLIE